MKLGLVDMIGLATTLVFAFPVGQFGIMRAMDGDVVFGLALVVVAVSMVVIPQYFFDPGRILRALIFGLLPGPLGSSSDDAEEPAETAEK